VCTYIKTFALTRVRLDQNFCFYLCARTSKVFFCVGFHQKVCFDSCAPASKSLLSLYALSSKLFLLLVCANIKSLLFCVHFYQNVALTCVRLDQNFCFYLCARTSKVFFLCVWAYINMFAFTRVRLHRILRPLVYPIIKGLDFFVCIHLLMFACTILRLHQMSVIFACATISKYLLFLHRNGCM